MKIFARKEKDFFQPEDLRLLIKTSFIIDRQHSLWLYEQTSIVLNINFLWGAIVVCRHCYSSFWSLKKLNYWENYKIHISCWFWKRKNWELLPRLVDTSHAPGMCLWKSHTVFSEITNIQNYRKVLQTAWARKNLYKHDWTSSFYFLRANRGSLTYEVTSQPFLC